MSDGLNPHRQARVAELLSDFRTLQYYIAAAPTSPSNPNDYYTEGWAALRQCALDGQHILNCAADISIPRHEAQKIYLRQAAAQRWVGWRDQVVAQGGGQEGLEAIDVQLRIELANITDEAVLGQLHANDIGLGRWIDEDPSLMEVHAWLCSRAPC
ncbi:unnamed protein product [Sordaria macrospora k-hell]|uniref:WGS project CABT00000000 data, contig 2.26 n=2 Tax=Sordaria macrospora TaxID=5147 RepID=F7W3W9_SORMK|nr:uncharacterized protein SMAC_05499 [Sordaria macrospora k-hell]CCC12322.1 unnamed protein product [Sordaria macrospora k-hell]